MAKTKPSTALLKRTSNREALYLQIEKWMRTAIASQSLQAGDRLPTEAELCKRFDVSRSTVRQAISRLEREGTILRIRGKGTFLRQINAPAPVSAREKTVGLIACRKNDTLQMEVLLGLESAAKSRNYSVIFSCSGDSADGELQEIERMLQRDVQGMVVMPVSNCATTPGVQRLMEAKLPVVLVDRYLTDLQTDYVTADNYAGAFHATEHLIILGYRRLAYICIGDNALSTSSVAMRYKGYCGALDAYGLSDLIQPEHKINVEDPNAIVELLDALAQTVPLNDLPPAIVAAHDAIALSFMRTAARLGRFAPRDFAIVGFDDLPIASQISVPLTTVAQPRFDMGYQAGHMLIDKIEGLAVNGGRRELPVSLVVRESCGAHKLVRERDAVAAQ